MTTVEVVSERVGELEIMMMELTRNVNRLSLEMSEFKDEMRRGSEGSWREMEVFRDEMSEFKDEMRQGSEKSWRETEALQRTVAEVSQRLDVFAEENRQENRNLNRSIAKVSQKMGTMAEDIIAPSIPRILQEAMACAEEPQMIGVRIRKRLPDGRSQEYDVIAVCEEYLLINETKSRLRPEDIPAFIERLQMARDFLPEYADKQIVGALATFYIDSSLITHGDRQGLIMLGMAEGLAELLNQAEFTPKLY